MSGSNSFSKRSYNYDLCHGVSGSRITQLAVGFGATISNFGCIQGRQATERLYISRNRTTIGIALIPASDDAGTVGKNISERDWIRFGFGRR